MGQITYIKKSEVQTELEELQGFYDMLQSAYQELQADNDRLNKQLYMRDKRYREKTDKYEQFITLHDRVNARPSKLLTNSDKVLCNVILGLLFFGKCEQRGIYKRVLLEE